MTASTSAPTTITTYYLEMHALKELVASDDAQGLHVVEAIVKQYPFNRFLYEFVGRDCAWTDKLSWSNEQWKAYVESRNLRTWVGYFKGSPAGYFELQKQDHGDVEISYFGLVKEYIGKGFGAYLLTQAIRSAWAWRDTERVWLHTCSLDHPSALRNYKSRGLSIYKKEEHSISRPR